MSLQELRLQEPVAQRSQRKWMMHPGSVGIKSSSPWVAFHQCKRGDGRGPGHVNPHPPFRLPRGHSVHVLPLQPIKGNSVHPVGASAVWLQPGTHVPHIVSQLLLPHFLFLSLTALGLPSQLKQPCLSVCLSFFLRIQAKVVAK